MLRAIPLLILLLIILVIVRVGSSFLVVNEEAHSYVLHVPPELDLNQQVPLLLVLHGGGDSAWQMRRYADFDRIADHEGFIVVYPQGTENRWNDGRVFDGATLESDDVEFIAALIEHLLAEYNIDPEHVYITGMSNGGFMAFRLGCELSDRIAGIAPVTATFSLELAAVCAPAYPLKVLIINGTGDPVVPYEGGEVRGPLFGQPRGQIHATDDTLYFWAQHNRCADNPDISLEPDTSPTDGSYIETWTFTDCEAPVKLYSIIGGGHTWPGAAQQFPVAVMGRVNRDFHASEVIWTFFSSD